MSVTALLQQVLALLASVYGAIQTILGYSAKIAEAQLGIADLIEPTAKEHVPYQIETTVDTISLALADPTTGLAAILAAVTALGSPQQATVPVTLPNPAPSGYGGSSASDTAGAVWDFAFPDADGNTAEFVLAAAYWFAHHYASAGRFGHADSPWLVFAGTIDDPDVQPLTTAPPVNPSTILASDATVVDWLNRVYPGPPWEADFPNVGYVGFETFGGGFLVCTMDAATFALYKLINAGSLGGATGAPVWPGLANVTLLDPHDIAPPGENIDVECDGVIIDITGVPSWAGKFSFGAATSWRNVGAVTFTSDNGQEEFAQTFSWSSGVYLTKAQTRAAGYAYRAAVGVSGTITAFTINST